MWATNYYLLFAFGAMILWAFGDFFIQKAARKIGDLETLAFIGILGSLALFPFVARDLPNIFSFETVFLLVFLGLITFIAAIIDFEALKISKLSAVDIVMEIELPITIALSYFFLHEKLSVIQISIILIIIAGTFLIATDSWSNWKLKLEKGIMMAFLAAIGMGLVDFFTSVSSRNISPVMAVWFPWLVFSILCLVFLYKRKGLKKFLAHSGEFKWLVLALAIFDTLAWLFYALATQKEKVGITLAITEAYPAIALFLGLWFNKEKINWHQGVGAGLALVGSVVLAFFVS